MDIYHLLNGGEKLSSLAKQKGLTPTTIASKYSKAEFWFKREKKHPGYLKLCELFDSRTANIFTRQGFTKLDEIKKLDVSDLVRFPGIGYVKAINILQVLKELDTHTTQ